MRQRFAIITGWTIIILAFCVFISNAFPPTPPTVNITGNAATATSLASNPTDCGANTVATAIDAAGNLTCAKSIGTDVQAYDADLTTWAGVTPGANVTTVLATPSSANLANAITDETGTGALVFATSPTLVTPALGTPSSATLTNATGLPATGVVGTAAVIANTIKGDGTAGRVLRQLRVVLEDGTEASHIKASTENWWNGDANNPQDNIGKDGVNTGVWNLDATGSKLQLLDSGISGTLIAILSVDVVLNYTATAFRVNYQVSSTNMYLDFRDTITSTARDLTLLLDTGKIVIVITYVTSA